MLISRLTGALLTIWLAVTITFITLRVLPGDPISAQAREAGLTESEIALQRQLSGIDAPLPEQYVHYWLDVLSGNWGRSLYTGLTVREMISQQLGNTLWLAGYSTLLAVVLGISIGYTAAVSTKIALRRLANAFIDLSLAIPVYWTGTLVVFMLATAIDGLRSQPWLPVMVLGFHTSGAIARVIQAQVHDVMQQPYIQVAVGKGLKAQRIQWVHVLRPTLAVILPVIVLQFGYLLSGTVITESIFQRSGMGTLLLRATLQQDYPVVQGVVLITAIAYVVLTLIADLASYYLDPRLRIASVTR